MLTTNVALLFPSADAFYAFYILWLIWFCFEMIFSWVTPIARNKGEIKFEDRGSTALTIAGSIACFVIIYWLSLNGILLLPGWFTYIGLLLFVTGMLFRFWAILVLGKYFSPIPGIYKEHRIISKGPYAFVRHPSYSGALLMLFSYGIILRSPLGSIITLFVMLLVYLYRIKVEEAGLVRHFGDAYAAYAEGKRMIIPYLL